MAKSKVMELAIKIAGKVDEHEELCYLIDDGVTETVWRRFADNAA